MSKLLSIIIPTYNMEKYLRKCLNSLIVSDENMKLLEILVVNDGSKDSSSQIAHEYESRFPYTFSVIDKENGNYGSCINRGLKEATGKYIKVLDADDYFDTKIFDKYLTFLQSTDVDMILTDYNIVDTEGKITKQMLIPYKGNVILNVADYCEEIFWVKDLQMHAVTYRRSKLIEHNYTQTTGVSYTDQEWVFMPITYMDTFCHYQGVLYQYLVGRTGQTVDINIVSKQVQVRFNLIYKRIDYFKNACAEQNFDKAKKNFLNNRLLLNVYLIYWFGLLCDTYPEEMLIAFDREIKSRSLYLYDNLAKSKLCRYRNMEFIDYWRKTRSLPFIIKIIKKIKRK